MEQVLYLVRHYGVAVVFVNVLLEFSALPVPSYPILMVVGALTLTGQGAVPMFAAALAAAILADCGWYAAGALWGRNVLIRVCRMSLSPDLCARRTETGFIRVGPWALLFVKFIPGVALATVVLSGIVALRFPLFLLFDAIGDTVYLGLAIILGRVFHNAITAMMATFLQLGKYGAILVASLFGLYLSICWIRRQAFMRRLRMDRISAGELAALIGDGRSPVIVDIRPPETRIREGVIPGALAAVPSSIPALLKEYPRETEIVIYCSYPNEESAMLAALELKQAGFKRIRPLMGGIEAWSKAGHRLKSAS